MPGSVRSARGVELRRNKDGDSAEGRVRLAIAWLGFIPPLHGYAGDTQAAQQRCDILRALFGKSGFFDQTVSIRQERGSAVSSDLDVRSADPPCVGSGFSDHAVG